MGQWMLAEEGCWAGWGCCLKGPKVSPEEAAVAAATGLTFEIVAAAVQTDADVAALHC